MRGSCSVDLGAECSSTLSTMRACEEVTQSEMRFKHSLSFLVVMSTIADVGNGATKGQ